METLRIFKKTIKGGRDLIREKIRKRDDYTCKICGKKWVVGFRRLDVHHIDCVKEKTRQYDNYELEKDNMITLCHKCHLNIPKHREEMSKKRVNHWLNRKKLSTGTFKRIGV
jgi:5-methylcytosine-specific restriction endonuclease McrA